MAERPRRSHGSGSGLKRILQDQEIIDPMRHERELSRGSRLLAEDGGRASSGLCSDSPEGSGSQRIKSDPSSVQDSIRHSPSLNILRSKNARVAPLLNPGPSGSHNSLIDLDDAHAAAAAVKSVTSSSPGASNRPSGGFPHYPYPTRFGPASPAMATPSSPIAALRPSAPSAPADRGPHRLSATGGPAIAWGPSAAVDQLSLRQMSLLGVSPARHDIPAVKRSLQWRRQGEGEGAAPQDPLGPTRGPGAIDED